jgi:GDP-L-fucose synthase
VFQAYCENIFHVGETGAGHVIKLLNNFLGQAITTAAAEAFAVGAKAGIDVGQLVRVVSAGAVNSGLFQAMAKYPPKKVFFAGTAASYSYPYKQIPLQEEDFLSGDVHDGEFGYAWSKRIAYPWLRILRDEFGTKSIYGILTNLFGPNDRFIGSHTHVIPALIRRAHDTNLKGSTALDVWGFPTTTRDFLYATEAARLIVSLISSATVDPKNFFVNIGSGVETSILATAEVIASEFEIKKIMWLHDKPVGVHRRYLDISKLVEFGIQIDSNFKEDLVSTINWYKANFEVVR